MDRGSLRFKHKTSSGFFLFSSLLFHAFQHTRHSHAHAHKHVSSFALRTFNLPPSHFQDNCARLASKALNSLLISAELVLGKILAFWNSDSPLIFSATVLLATTMASGPKTCICYEIMTWKVVQTMRLFAKLPLKVIALESTVGRSCKTDEPQMHHAKCKKPDTRDAHGIAWLQLHDILGKIKSQEGGINECLPEVGEETDWKTSQWSFLG